MQPGDRVLFWRTQGGRSRQAGGWRGVMGFAAVTSAPCFNDGALELGVNLAQVWFLPTPLQRREGDPTDPLETLKLKCDAREGSVFRVRPEQWAGVLAAVGGWPGGEPSASVDDADMDDGQGFLARAKRRRQIEDRAMSIASCFWESWGYTVADVSRRGWHYDLHCTKAGCPDVRVEVKGTTDDGTSVFLTAPEVRHARAQFPNVALYIVSGINLEAGTIGGVRCHYPWDLDEGTLAVERYRYALPRLDPTQPLN
jgi:hypothetical protein